MSSVSLSDFEEVILSRDTRKAKEFQLSLAADVRIIPLAKPPDFIAGADAYFQDGRVSAAACLFRYPEMICVEESLFTGEASFPYIPGLFAFREGPALINAIGKLKKPPDLILIDGHGIAHPRGSGLASCVGLVLRIPAIGCAKSRLIGEYKEPGTAKGQWTYLFHDRKKIGAVVRTRSCVRPLFVSPGHLVDIEDSVRIVLNSTAQFRIPEPLRAADMLSKKMKKLKI